MKLTKAAIEKRAAKLGWSITWCTQQNDSTSALNIYPFMQFGTTAFITSSGDGTS